MAVHPRDCQVCGTTFTPPPTKASSKYCSRGCRGSAERAQRVERDSVEMTCDVCGDTYSTTNTRQKRCSRPCTEEANRRRERARKGRASAKRTAKAAKELLDAGGLPVVRATAVFEGEVNRTTANILIEMGFANRVRRGGRVWLEPTDKLRATDLEVA